MTHYAGYASRHPASALPKPSPFAARSASAEGTIAVLAGAALHPDDEVRRACRSAISDRVGAQALSDAVRSVRIALEPLADDPLEPMVLDEGDVWVIAALDLLRSDAEPLRITSRDALDCAGGVLLARGANAAKRVPRRKQDGSWNLPTGSAFYPDLMTNWVTRSSKDLRCEVEVLSAEQSLVLRVSNRGSGLDRLLDSFVAVQRGPWSSKERAWYFGGASLEESGAARAKPKAPYDARARAAAEASLQQHARILPSGDTVTAAGGLVSVGERHTEICFKKPESIIRLMATFSSPGVVELPAIRPWGWLVFGTGLDKIDFVRSAHADPPLWARVPDIAILELPESLMTALGRWIGPCVGSANIVGIA
jgi:hypothetical protein